MISEILIRIILIFIFNKIVYYYPGLEKYNKTTKFNFYRSLMCLYFSFYSTDLVINNFKEGISSPVIYKNVNFNDVTNWFISYLIYDLFIVFTNKNKRLDLIIHHSFCLFIYTYQKIKGHCNYGFIILLITEVMSIVSGIDNIAKEENDIKLSCKFKKTRLFIIRNIRIPIWIVSLLLVIRFNKHFDSYFEFYLCLGGPLLMIYLDNYWENKCVKFIKKNSKIYN